MYVSHITGGIFSKASKTEFYIKVGQKADVNFLRYG